MAKPPRCGACNIELKGVGIIPPPEYKIAPSAYTCPKCGKFYDENGRALDEKEKGDPNHVERVSKDS